MSIKHSFTKSDYLDWNEAISLINRLQKDGKMKSAAFIAAGIFLGLRIGDIKCLTWNNLLNQESFHLIETKTDKPRSVKVNPELRKIVEKLYSGQNPGDLIFGCSIQFYNRLLKQLKFEYKLKIGNFSTHSLRKTFGRRVWQMDNYSEKAVVLLSEIFNHSNTNITRRYLGIRQQEIENVYDLL